jgi:uracil DNA glycosylase
MVYPDYFKLPTDWTEFFYSQEMENILADVSDKIPPTTDEIFKCFYSIPLEDVKVVFVTKSPDCLYHTKEKRMNKNLQKIYKELTNEGFYPFKDGNMDHLTKQGVLFLTESFTGDDVWSSFFIYVVKALSKQNVIWLLLKKEKEDYR